jgi:eukaryotic-like serine/threonine-protein kinase
LSLTPGTRVGAYEVLALLGSGGMGEVYRARDTRLQRDVALKVLPDAFTLDADRLARFKREAQLLASLNHQNIGAIYGLEQADGAQALVLELVEGPTLAERLQQGRLPVEEALAHAIQVAEALETAHEQGIVHRDLKPANVKLTKTGSVKVLDFGLAKAMERRPAAGTIANSPTLSVLATQAGIIMGTAAYMSPEQAKGAETDRRADIFSFGVVLYEMLTGRQPFHGETAAEIMASVLIRDADVSALPADLNPRIQALIKRCLEKHPRKRWQAIGDVRAELESIAAAPYRSDTAPAHIVMPLWKRALPVAVGVVVTAAASTLANRWLANPPAREIVRFSIPAPDFRGQAAAIAMSPDGTRLLYVGVFDTDKSQLMMRSLGDWETRPIPGTATVGAIQSPTFSPDGRFVAYFDVQTRTLKKIAVTGGAAVTLCTAPPTGVPIGISWRADMIAFSLGTGTSMGQGAGIFTVSSNGGEPHLAVRIDAGSAASRPQIVDDRGSILFAMAPSGLNSIGRWDAARIILQTPDGTRHVVLDGGTDPRSLPSGHLLYAVGGTILAIPFDVASARVTGAPFPVLEGVARSPTGSSAQFGISASGSIAYVPGPATGSSGRTLGLMNVGNGKVQPLPMAPNAYAHPRLSPDGHLVAVASDDGRDATIWIYDVVRGGPPRRLTFSGHNRSPIWTPDGQFITYQSDRDGNRGLFLQRADGTGTVERLTKAEAGFEHFPESWTPDGKILSFTMRSPMSSVWTVSREGDRAPKPLLQSKDRSYWSSEFSPDGRWITYSSNELTGITGQVFVQPFPPTGAKFMVTTQVSGTPAWSRDGKRLFFAYSDRVFAADIQTSPVITASQSVELPAHGNLASTPGDRHFDPMTDGEHLLVVLTDPSEDPSRGNRQINVVTNWVEELMRRVPTK